MNFPPLFRWAIAAAIIALALWFGLARRKQPPAPQTQPAASPSAPTKLEPTPATSPRSEATTTNTTPIAISAVTPGAPLVRTSPKPREFKPAPPVPEDTSPIALARADLENIGLMFRDYRTRMGENPVGSNAEIMRAIMGGNPFQARLGPPDGQSLNENGELVDRWGTAYFFHQLSKTQMETRSAGPDRIMWNGDDLVSK